MPSTPIPASGATLLDEAQARSVVQQMNAARAAMTGVNRQAIPSGKVMTRPDGRVTVTAPDDRAYTLRSSGTLAAFQHRNERVTFAGDGRIRSLHTPSIDVTNGAHGERTVISRRPDRVLVVGTGRRSGYVQEPVTIKGNSYLRRSYVVGERSFTRLYSYSSQDGTPVRYVPRYRYAPEFYGWVYYPWIGPIVYAWAWGKAGWYNHYGYYFVGSPFYMSAAVWLTDFYLGQILRAAYESQFTGDDSRPARPARDVAADSKGEEWLHAEESTPISPELKQDIAAEIQEQVARENAAANDPSAPPTVTDMVLDPGQVFVVDTAMDVQTANERSCHLSAGDAIRLIRAPIEGSVMADASVASSFAGDCPAAAQILVPLEELGEMHASFRAQLDDGLLTLRNEQGQSGLPSAPIEAMASPPRPAENVAEEVSERGQEASKELEAVLAQADLAEKALTNAAFATELSESKRPDRRALIVVGTALGILTLLFWKARLRGERTKLQGAAGVPRSGL
ncbi:MAG TPA: hypothetical protein VMK12_02350 [Anaeromyxobacteraceae bacterium]|nr:hypothetical protein [Anaeromyxobacteraceae bacterium]